jgi:heterodisulfide reductase subunit B
MVLRELGIKLVDVPEFSCCPEPVGFYTNMKFTGTAVAARNIALAEEEGHDIMTLCNGCAYTLKQVNASLKENEELRQRINETLSVTDHQFKGKIEVKHFAQVLNEDLGLEVIEKKVERSLNGFKIAGHTGCHIVSPPDIMQFDDPIDPMILDEMILTLGAEAVDYDLKTLCCGWTLTNYGDKDAANKLISDKLVDMKRVSSECVTVICPQCFYQFDTGQMLASRRTGLDFKLPVLFYLQLLALSIGYGLEDIGYRKNRVKDKDFETKLMGVLT